MLHNVSITSHGTSSSGMGGTAGLVLDGVYSLFSFHFCSAIIKKWLTEEWGKRRELPANRTNPRPHGRDFGTGRTVAFQSCLRQLSTELRHIEVQESSAEDAWPSFL